MQLSRPCISAPRFNMNESRSEPSLEIFQRRSPNRCNTLSRPSPPRAQCLVRQLELRLHGPEQHLEEQGFFRVEVAVEGRLGAPHPRADLRHGRTLETHFAEQPGGNVQDGVPLRFTRPSHASAPWLSVTDKTAQRIERNDGTGEAGPFHVEVKVNTALETEPGRIAEFGSDRDALLLAKLCDPSVRSAESPAARLRPAGTMHRRLIHFHLAGQAAQAPLEVVAHDRVESIFPAAHRGSRRFRHQACRRISRNENASGMPRRR